MAGKKEPSIKESMEELCSVLERIQCVPLLYQNRNILLTTLKGINIGIIVEQALWNEMWKNPLIEFRFKEFKADDPYADVIKERFRHLEEYDESKFLPIDGKDIYDGKSIEIKHELLEWELMINKSLFPIRLKKSECNNIGYQVKKDSYTAFILKKTFDSKIPDGGFTLVRCFKVL